MPNLNSSHILVGLGGTGGKILKAFKMRMFEEFRTPEERAEIPVSIVYVDSSTEMVSLDGTPKDGFQVLGQDASFTKNEFLNIKGVNINQILSRPQDFPKLDKLIANAEDVSLAIGNLGEAAGQKRRAGRILFAANADNYVKKLQSANRRNHSISPKNKLTVHIFAGLSGGTGSGAIIDSIIQARKTFPEAKILVYAMIPEKDLPKDDMDQGRYYQNGYAALNELNALQTGRWVPKDVTSEDDQPHSYFDSGVKGVATGVYVYSNENANDMVVNSFTELPKIVSDFVFSRIFMVKEGEARFEDLVKAFNLENKDPFALEWDESENSLRKSPIRTKKISSFCVKRIMYPQNRIHNHITYTIGESILNQIKYNNWKENKGYQAEDRRKDFKTDYFTNDELLSSWKIDMAHLTLDKKILDPDPDYPTIADYWDSEVINCAPTANKQKHPLEALKGMLNESFTGENGQISFRGLGVEQFYKIKGEAIRDMAYDIRTTVEKDLFRRWYNGEISTVELQKIALEMNNFLYGRNAEGQGIGLKAAIQSEIVRNEELIAAIEIEESESLSHWNNRGFLKIVTDNVFGSKEQHCQKHSEILKSLFIAKTDREALTFASRLVERLIMEMQTMHNGINEFARKINEAIEKTGELISGQRKVNGGIENCTGVIVEVSEEAKIQDFEINLKADHNQMPNIATKIRQTLIPVGDFKNFDDFASRITTEKFKNAFDLELSKEIVLIHDKIPAQENKILGLNVLSQLNKLLRDDIQIRKFVHDVVEQSGPFLKLDNTEMERAVTNNDSPQQGTSINCRTITVLIPPVDENNDALKSFADKLEAAFKDSISQESGNVYVDRNSPRKDELSVISLQYCFPMRAISWLKDYKNRYERLLHSRNESSNLENSILLHSEGDGRDLPSLFIVEEDMRPAASSQSKPEPKSEPESKPESKSESGTVPPPPPGKPKIALYAYIGGQQLGPKSYDECEKMAEAKDLTPDTQVWMEGMANWAPASQVEVLKPLFVVKTPPKPPVEPDPVISLYAWLNGQQAGPYDFKGCRMLVEDRQMTPDTQVWMEGMANWAPASQVKELESLFKPKMPPAPPTRPAGPPMPPTGPNIPPMR